MSLLKRGSLATLLTGLLGALQVLPALAQQEKAGEVAGTALGIGLIICLVLAAIVGIVLLVLWIVMLVDCIKREEKDFPGSTGNSKTIWLVILLVSWLFSLYWLAAIIYYFMVKRKAAGVKPTAEETPPPPTEPPTEQV